METFPKNGGSCKQQLHASPARRKKMIMRGKPKVPTQVLWGPVQKKECKQRLQQSHPTCIACLTAHRTFASPACLAPPKQELSDVCLTRPRVQQWKQFTKSCARWTRVRCVRVPASARMRARACAAWVARLAAGAGAAGQN